MKKNFLSEHEKFLIGGMVFIHVHIVKGKAKGIENEWRIVGKRTIANCSFCGIRAERITRPKRVDE